MRDWSIPDELRDVPGAQALYDWFGYWPTLHDGELVDIVLRTQGLSLIRIYTCGFTGAVDAHGYFEQTKHITVSFILDEIIDVDLRGFSSQNVMNAVTLVKTGDRYRVEMEPVYGIYGSITAKHVRIELEPGMLRDRPGFTNPLDVRT